MLNSEAMVVHFPAAPVVCYPPALDTAILTVVNHGVGLYSGSDCVSRS